MYPPCPNAPPFSGQLSKGRRGLSFIYFTRSKRFQKSVNKLKVIYSCDLQLTWHWHTIKLNELMLFYSHTQCLYRENTWWNYETFVLKSMNITPRYLFIGQGACYLLCHDTHVYPAVTSRYARKRPLDRRIKVNQCNCNRQVQLARSLQPSFVVSCECNLCPQKCQGQWECHSLWPLWWHTSYCTGHVSRSIDLSNVMSSSYKDVRVA